MLFRLAYPFAFDRCGVGVDQLGIAEFLDNGISTWQFFQNSSDLTAHIITDIDQLGKVAETVLWRYLREAKCKHYNYTSKRYDIEQFCYGMVIMTTRDKNKF